MNAVQGMMSIFQPSHSARTPLTFETNISDDDIRAALRWGLYQLSAVLTRSLKAPGFNP
jgi:hypothetical protein